MCEYIPCCIFTSMQAENRKSMQKREFKLKFCLREALSEERHLLPKKGFISEYGFHKKTTKKTCLALFRDF